MTSKSSLLAIIAIGVSIIGTPYTALTASTKPSRCERVTTRQTTQNQEPDSLSISNLTEVERLKGKHGGRLIVVRNYHPTWFIEGYQEGYYPEPLGNPTYPLHYLSKKILKHFGFEFWLDNWKAAQNRERIRYVSIPTASEVNGAISALNKKIKSQNDRILTTYYSVNGMIDDRAYLQRWAEETALPIATAPDLFLHDINYHLWGGILMPNTWVKRSKEVTKVLFDFENWVKKNRPQLAKKREFVDIMQKLFSRRANEMDYNGNIPYVLQDWSLVAMQQRLPIYQTLTGWGQSLTEYLTSSLLEADRINYKPNGENLSIFVHQSRVKNDLSEALQSFREASPELSAPPELEPLSSDGVIEALEARIHFLENALKHR